MPCSRVTLCLLLLVGQFHATHSVAQSRENIVLLPIEVSPEYANQENVIGIALQQSLSKNFNVFYGDSVEDALQAEYAKEDCTAESCVQNIAILFNGEIVVDAAVQRIENSAFLSVQFRNVITGELAAVLQDSCKECSFTQLINFIDERASDIALNSSQGLTALLEKQAEPVKTPVATPQREQPKPSVTVSQEPINPRPKPTNSQPKVAKSSSYWKWGLGALVLGAAGGGGGGGGSDGGYTDSGSNQTESPSDSGSNQTESPPEPEPTVLSQSVAFENMQDVREARRRTRFQNSESDFSNKAYRIVIYNEEGNEGVELGTSRFVGAPYSNTNDYSYSNVDFDFQTDGNGNLEYSRFHAFYTSYVDDRTYTFDSALDNSVMEPLDYDGDNVPDLYYWSAGEEDNIRYPIIIGSGAQNVGTHMPNYFWYGAIYEGDGSAHFVHDGLTSTEGNLPLAGSYDFSGGISGYFVNADDNSNVVTDIFAELSVNADFNYGTVNLSATNSSAGDEVDYSFLDFSATGEIDGPEVELDEVTFANGYFQDADDVDIYGRFYGPNGDEFGGSFAFLKLGPVAERQKGQWYAGAFGVTDRSQLSTQLFSETVLFVSTSSFDSDRVFDTLDKGRNDNYLRTGIVPGTTRNESYSGAVSGDLFVDVQSLNPSTSTSFASFSYGSSQINLFTLDEALGDYTLTDNGRRAFFSDRGLSDNYEDFLSVYTNVGATDEYEAVILSGLGKSGGEYSAYAFAQGNNTPNSSIPSLNGETFTGFSNGVYFDGTTNAPKITRSDIDISFTSDSLASLTSNNTRSRDPSGDRGGAVSWQSASDLNFSQTLRKSTLFQDDYLYQYSSDSSPSALGSSPTDKIRAEFFGNSGETIAGTFYFAEEQQLYQGAFYTKN